MDIFEIFEDILSDDEEVINLIERPRRPKIFRERIDHMEQWDEQAFIDRFRISKDSVLMILEKIEQQIRYRTKRNRAVDPLRQLLLTLRFYASGSVIICVSDFIGIHKTTASRIIDRVTRAICSLAHQYIKLPSTPEEISEMQLQFYKIARFPKVIGAIDCTHVRIQSPGGDDAERFRNRKGYFSINVQTVADTNLKIQNIVCRWPGSAHDQLIFNNSRLLALMQNTYKDCFLVGDSGYNIETFLMTPLNNPVTRAENLYNESQIRTRNVVERSYGVWKKRFPCLSKGLGVKLERTLNIIVATAVLHNIAVDMNDPEPSDTIIAENYTDNEPVIDRDSNGNAVRTNLINNYFNLLQ